MLLYILFSDYKYTFNELMQGHEQLVRYNACAKQVISVNIKTPKFNAINQI